jgi:hypothetical protein
MRAKITEIMPDDAYYEDRDLLAGLVGEIQDILTYPDGISCYFASDSLNDDPRIVCLNPNNPWFCFHRIKIEEIAET